MTSGETRLTLTHLASGRFKSSRNFFGAATDFGIEKKGRSLWLNFQWFIISKRNGYNYLNGKNWPLHVNSLANNRSLVNKTKLFKSSKFF